MSLKRLYVNDRLSPGSELRLGDETSRYLGRVLRLKHGDTVNVFNGEDGEWTATIMRIEKHNATLVVHDTVSRDPESRLHIHLVQGISRGERMDFVVQKATELGVNRISPVLTDHGVVRFDDERAAKRRQHWRRVAENACEQSGRIRPPLVDEPLPLRHWFGSTRERDGVSVILRPGVATRLAELASPKSGLRLLVGPEGGFSEREYGDAEAAGFDAVTLGPRVLRTETAAVAAIAIAQSRWGDV
jgi:16S rRNA (uracil1498-N3)-methyltransferase